MGNSYKVGDKVRWNSEVGHVSGKVIRVHTRDVEFKGRQRRASDDEPQYEVKSDKTGATAMHHAEALTRQS